MATDNCLPKVAICRVSGVASVSTSPIIVLMRPISVATPVAVTTPTPLPDVTSVPENAMAERSPMPASSWTGSGCLCVATDSPVSADSSICRLVVSINRTSAGTRSPDRNRTTSPGTSSSAST